MTAPSDSDTTISLHVHFMKMFRSRCMETQENTIWEKYVPWFPFLNILIFIIKILVFITQTTFIKNNYDSQAGPVARGPKMTF